MALGSAGRRRRCGWCHATGTTGRKATPAVGPCRRLCWVSGAQGERTPCPLSEDVGHAGEAGSRARGDQSATSWQWEPSVLRVT